MTNPTVLADVEVVPVGDARVVHPPDGRITMPPGFADTTTAARLAESADICEGHIAKMRPGMPQCLRETGAMGHLQQPSSKESAPCQMPLMHMLGSDCLYASWGRTAF